MKRTSTVVQKVMIHVHVHLYLAGRAGTTLSWPMCVCMCEAGAVVLLKVVCGCDRYDAA